MFTEVLSLSGVLFCESDGKLHYVVFWVEIRLQYEDTLFVILLIVSCVVPQAGGARPPGLHQHVPQRGQSVPGGAGALALRQLWPERPLRGQSGTRVSAQSQHTGTTLNTPKGGLPSRVMTGFVFGSIHSWYLVLSALFLEFN